MRLFEVLAAETLERKIQARETVTKYARRLRSSSKELGSSTKSVRLLNSAWESSAVQLSANGADVYGAPLRCNWLQPLVPTGWRNKLRLSSKPVDCSPRIRSRLASTSTPELAAHRDPSERNIEKVTLIGQQRETSVIQVDWRHLSFEGQMISHDTTQQNIPEKGSISVINHPLCIQW